MPRRPTSSAFETAARAAPPPGRHAVGPAVVPRPALVDRLRTLTRRSLTVIVAPTGYGKTTLLADWAHEEERRVAWLSLEPPDAEPRRLWRRVAQAVALTPSGTAEPARATAVPAERAVDLLLNELADGPELVLVLDDFQALGGAGDESVSYLLERLPERVCVVLAARSQPTLELGSLPGSGELGLLTRDDLRLDRPEIAAAAALEGATLSETELELVEERTEGWAAGVRLASLSLRRPRGLEQFGGASQHVAEYFEDEVLARLGGELRAFLVQSSILDRLSAPLCDALLDRDDSAARLVEAERAGAFVVPVDGERALWRCHRLFGEFLRSQLDPDLGLRLHRRASALLEDAGRVDEAVAHAVAAGRRAPARALLLRHWRNLAAHERIAEADAALVALDQPALSLAAAWVAAGKGLAPDAPSTVREPLPFGTGDAEIETALARAWFSHDDLAAAERLRKRVEALPTRDPLVVAASTAALGHALHAAGRDEDALAALAGLDLARAGEAPAPTVRALAVRSRACERLRRPAAAAAAARTAAALVARHGLEGTPAAELLRGAEADPQASVETNPRRRRARADLTPAEVAVLRLLPGRLTQREIARELYVSPNTVKTHVSAIRHKLGVASRADAVAAARRLNLLPG